MRLRLAAVASVFLLVDLAFADTGDPRVVRGTLEWPAVLGSETIAVVRGDDGMLYYTDASRAERRGSPISGRVSIVGVEGAQPHEIVAIAIGSGDGALAAVEPAPIPPPGVAASPRMTPPAPPAPAGRPDPRAAAATATGDDLWQIQGKVQAVTATDIVLETPQGPTYRVDATKLSPWTKQALRPGDEIKLFGIAQPDRRLVANGFIQLMAPTPAASPSSR